VSIKAGRSEKGRKGEKRPSGVVREKKWGGSYGGTRCPSENRLITRAGGKVKNLAGGGRALEDPHVNGVNGVNKQGRKRLKHTTRRRKREMLRGPVIDFKKKKKYNTSAPEPGRGRNAKNGRAEEREKSPA